VVASAFGTGARAATAAAVRARANRSILRIASSVSKEDSHLSSLERVLCADALGQSGLPAPLERFILMTDSLEEARQFIETFVP